MEKSNIKGMTAAAICLTLCMVLPLLTGQIQPFGAALAPMHIPVLLCGFICGSRNAALIGIIAPPLRFMLFGMPPIMPVGMAMIFELAAYGLAAGILARKLPKNTANIYITLLISMLVGRIAWGLAMWRIASVTAGMEFGFRAFLDGAFVTALPGIVLHILLIPPLVMAMRKLKIAEN